MTVASRRTLKATVAILGISALSALGSGTAFAATSTVSGPAADSHGASTADGADHSTPVSSSNDDLHSFAAPKLATHAAAPTPGYDDSSYNNDNSGYGGTDSS